LQKKQLLEFCTEISEKAFVVPQIDCVSFDSNTYNLTDRTSGVTTFGKTGLFIKTHFNLDLMMSSLSD